MDKIKILYIIDEIEHITAGTERQLSQLITFLDREKYEPHLMTLRSSKLLNSNYFPCPGHTLDMKSVLSISGYNKMTKLRDFIAESGFHIVQTFFPDSNVIGVIAAHKAGCRVIISSRRNTGWGHTAKTLLATRYANRYVTRFLANSEIVAKAVSMKEMVDRDRFSVIYNGLHPERFKVDNEEIRQARAFMGADDGKKIVGMVANLRPVKDIESFLEASAKVADCIGAIQFIIIGNGDSKISGRLANMAQALGLGEKMRFMGSIENPIPYIKNFDVGVLSSISEGLSNTLLEYGALGIPSVATNVGGAPEIIQDQKSGLLVPAGQPEKMAEAIIRLLDDDALRHRLGGNSFQLVWSKFSLPICIKLHQSLYTKLYDFASLASPGPDMHK